MTCSSVYALPCFGFELVTIIACARTQQQHMHPPQQQTDRQTDSSSTALSHARDLFARASTVMLLLSLCVSPGSADRLTETGGRILPGIAGQGE